MSDGKEIVGSNIGPEAHVGLSLTDAKALRIELSYKGADANAGMYAELPPRALLEKLKALIPGTIDDLIIDAAEKELGL